MVNGRRGLRDFADVMKAANEEAVLCAARGVGVNGRPLTDSGPAPRSSAHHALKIAPGLVPQLVFAVMAYLCVGTLAVGVLGWCLRWCVVQWGWVTE